MASTFKKKNVEKAVIAVADGDLIPMTKVEDNIFSTLELGDGYAIKPSANQIYAPVDGVITMLFPTKHAIGITSKDGLDILIHLGLDTVKLNGQPFDLHVEEGQKVKAGDLLVDMDVKDITDAGLDPIVIVVYTNTREIQDLTPVTEGKVKHGQLVQTFKNIY
ncbi:MAG: PTS glucose transporter subunit IIA [Lactobacillus sp.]|nr:PTS glucose transporter subunit IIA [Lactobacillus sp.]